MLLLAVADHALCALVAADSSLQAVRINAVALSATSLKRLCPSKVLQDTIGAMAPPEIYLLLHIIITANMTSPLYSPVILLQSQTRSQLLL